MSARRILSQIWGSFWAQLVKLPQYLSQLFCGLLHKIQSGHESRSPLPSTSAERAKELLFSPDELIPGDQLLHKSTPYPLTPQQVENSIQAFIASINKSAICALASRHNGGKSCRIIDQRNGSFNICFFVLFEAEDVKWVLRIPIEPVVSDTWAKVVSEVTTIKYIKSKTTIPCPDVHVYGHEDTLIEGVSTPFMLMECLHGKQLSTRAFFHATETQRRNLYIDLIDTLAQLRQLEFPAAGSLIPKPESPDELDPTIGPLLSMTVNEFERQRQMPQATEVYTSVKDYIDLHSHILSETFELPVQELEYEQAKMEMFALNSVAKEIRTCRELQEPSHSFVLAHPDLRCANILVDDDFHILGIVDWEFTSTVPRRLLLPPPWITGHDPDTLLMITGVPRHQILQEFTHVLQEMHEASDGWTLLWQDWGFQQGIHLQVDGPLLRLSPIFQILRHPSTLIDVYYSSIFRRIFGSGTCKDVVINDFFGDEENRDLVTRVELQMQRSERYTDHLRSRGLFIADERSQQLEDLLAKLENFMQARQEGLKKKGKNSISSG